MSGGNNIQGVRDFKNGNLYEAERRFRTAVKLNPNSADAHYNLGAVLHRKGVQQQDKATLLEAEHLYNACLSLNGEHVEAHREWAVLLAQTGRSQDAFKLLTNWKLRSPQSAEPRIELARLYEEFGDADSAEANLHEAIAISPRHEKARAALGYLQERSGDFGDATKNYQMAYQGNRDPKVAARLARIGNYSARSTDAPDPSNTQTATGGWTTRR